MHRYFEWDDSAAAESWRMEQARKMVRSVRIRPIEAPEQEPVRAFHIVTTETEGRGYASIPRIVVDENLTAQLVARAKQDLAIWRRRYKQLAKVPELAPLFAAVERVVEPSVERPTEQAVTA